VLQVASLIAGLTLAIVAFVAAGGWDSFGSRPQARPERTSAIASNDQPPITVPSFTASDSLVFVVVLVSTQAEAAAAEQQYASTAPGWHTEVVVLDGPQSEQDFQNAFNSLLRHGGPSSYRVVDLIRR
jgi:hypothetical protein